MQLDTSTGFGAETRRCIEGFGIEQDSDSTFQLLPSGRARDSELFGNLSLRRSDSRPAGVSHFELFDCFVFFVFSLSFSFQYSVSVSCAAFSWQKLVCSRQSSSGVLGIVQWIWCIGEPEGSFCLRGESVAHSVSRMWMLNWKILITFFGWILLAILQQTKTIDLVRFSSGVSDYSPLIPLKIVGASFGGKRKALVTTFCHLWSQLDVVTFLLFIKGHLESQYWLFTSNTISNAFVRVFLNVRLRVCELGKGNLEVTQLYNIGITAVWLA